MIRQGFSKKPNPYQERTYMTGCDPSQRSPLPMIHRRNSIYANQTRIISSLNPSAFIPGQRSRYYALNYPQPNLPDGLQSGLEPLSARAFAESPLLAHWQRENDCAAAILPKKLLGRQCESVPRKQKID
jgi:hypothetical protein